MPISKCSILKQSLKTQVIKHVVSPLHVRSGQRPPCVRTTLSSTNPPAEGNGFLAVAPNVWNIFWYSKCLKEQYFYNSHQNFLNVQLFFQSGQNEAIYVMESLPFGEDTAETLHPDIPPELWIHSAPQLGVPAPQDAATAEMEAPAPPVSGTSQKDGVGGLI